MLWHPPPRSSLVFVAAAISHTLFVRAYISRPTCGAVRAGAGIACVALFLLVLAACLAVPAAADGGWLASGSSDATVGHMDGVGALAVAPDGGWLASGSWDATIKVWEAATWQEIATLTGHTGTVWALAVAPLCPAGHWSATGGAWT